MKLQERIKSYKFWVGLSASLVFVLQWIGKAFGFEISAEIVNGITMGFCSVLMVFGFVEKPNKKQNNDSNEAVSIDNASEIYIYISLSHLCYYQLWKGYAGEEY